MASSGERSLEGAHGIFVEASIELLRKAAKRVLHDFSEIEETPPDDERPFDGEVKVGEAILFRENMDLCPAEIVAVKLDKEDHWFVMSTSECPPEKCSTAREAMRCGEAEEKKLRIIREYLQTKEGAKVEEIHKWEPDKRADAADVLRIITDASKRYSH